MGYVFGFLTPIKQDLAYHDFADKRHFLGIENFGDVVGNLFFMYFGAKGLEYIDKNRANSMMFVHEREERFLWRVFFASTIAVGFGSSYYHHLPNNDTLVWDRLPMTLAFMAFFTLILMEHVSLKIAKIMFLPLMCVGIVSVFYWQYTESQGEGDLRLYALVQFLPLLLIPLIMALFVSPYRGKKPLLAVIMWYLLAKVLEHFDKDIFELTSGMVSGHTLKHIAAAFAVYAMWKYLEKRKLH